MTDELRDEVLACAERTLAVPQVRVELRHDFEWHWPESQHRARRGGGLLRPVGRVAKSAGKAAGKAVWRRVVKGDALGHREGVGIVEPAARRYMLDFGYYAHLYKDGTPWDGASGAPLEAVGPSSFPDTQFDLWSLLDALRGITAVSVEGEETLHGARCRRLTARVDLSRASAAAPDGIHVPTVARFDELLALEFGVWIDDHHVRRVRFAQSYMALSTLTLDLIDFDPAERDLDWDRLPTFKSPDVVD